VRDPVAGTSVSLKFGNAKGIADVAAQIRGQIIERAAQATINRVQDRVKHPAADSLRTRKVNQWSCLIEGPRGGPGPIYPVKAKVLAFQVAGQTVFARQVQGVGLGPLIAAESQRITLFEIDADGVVVK
jgi:hypothetical protein